MKRGFATFAAAMTAVGVAGALAFAPAPESPQQPSPVVVTSVPTVAQAAIPQAAIPQAAIPQPAIPSGPAVEARRPPVPLLMERRLPFGEFDSDVIGPETVGRVGDRLSEAAAKAAIEADGYKSARVLRKGANGLWYAEAMRGATMVRLTVDAQGNVAAE